MQTGLIFANILSVAVLISVHQIFMKHIQHGLGTVIKSVIEILSYAVGKLRSLGWKGGEGNGNPLQYPCLENPMDGGAQWAEVHGVARSRTRLSDFTLFFHFHALEKEMATHSSVLAWRIPGRESLLGCCLWGHTESDMTEATQQQQQQQDGKEVEN